ncbi:anti-sigma factor domain-containing protein [Advenella sp. RU8]|uniref:anti-sigma factor domain-containing protein n=1 Tax=Advenella sp. RU8 TaxID=3399575 RepID=UPI003AB06A9A
MFNKSTSFQYEKTLKACGKGQKSAIQSLYKHDAPQMLALAFRIFGNLSYAEQAVQRAFVTIWKNAHTYNEEAGPAKGWIYSILRYHIGVVYKQHYDDLQSAQQNRDSALVEPLGHLQAGIHASHAPHTGFHAFLEELPLEPQSCLINMYFSSGEQAGTATLLNMPLGRFKENILLGLRHLSKKLDNFPYHAENEKIGEYVLGGLSGEEERHVLRLFNQDSTAASIALIWEEHFTHYLDQLPEQPLHPRLWSSIKHNMQNTEEVSGILDTIQEPGKPGLSGLLARIRETGKKLSNNLKLWQITSLVLAIVSVLLISIFPSSSNMAKMIAVLSSLGQNHQAAWVLKVTEDGTARLKPLVQQNIDENLEMEIWTQSAASSNDYRSLGTFKSSNPFTISPEILGQVTAGQLFQISLEPVGGSNANKPTGSILYQGSLIDLSN